MRALIWLIGIFALAVGVAMIAGVKGGYVLVVLSPWRAQISLNLFIVLLVAGVLLIHLLLRVLTRTLALPSRVAQWRGRRRRGKADGSRFSNEIGRPWAHPSATSAWSGLSVRKLARRIVSPCAVSPRQRPTVRRSPP